MSLDTKMVCLQCGGLLTATKSGQFNIQSNNPKCSHIWREESSKVPKELECSACQKVIILDNTTLARVYNLRLKGETKMLCLDCDTMGIDITGF